MRVPSDKSFMQDVWERMENGLRKVEGGPSAGLGSRSPATTTAPTLRSSPSSTRPRPRCQIPFWFAVAAPIIGSFLVVCTTRFVLAGKQFDSVKQGTKDAFRQANESQSILSEALLQNNTRLLYKLVLRMVRDEVKQFVIELPDRAVDGVWTHMLTHQRFAGGLEADSWDDRRQLGFAMWREISSHNALRPSLIERADGLMLGFENQAFSGVLPTAAPYRHHVNSTPDHCRRTWSWYDNGPEVPAATKTNITVYPIAGDGELSTPATHLENQRLITDQTFYEVQTRIKEENPEGDLIQAWSGIHALFDNQVMTSWTTPIAYCGNYSCMEGVIAASFTLASLNRWCNNTWHMLANKTKGDPYNFTLEENNSAIFVVQQDSVDHHRAQEGLVIGGGPGIVNVQEFSALQQAHESSQTMIKWTSQMIMAKYQNEWNATELQDEPHPFAFRVEKGENGSAPELLNDNYSPMSFGSEDKVFEVATLSLKLDRKTRWLVVLVLPVGAFSRENAETRATVQEVVSEALKGLSKNFDMLHIFNLAAFVVMVLCSFVLGLGLSAWVSRDLQSLSRYMRSLGSLNFTADSLEFQTLLIGRRSAISDVCEIQDAFCRLAQSVRTFARFVPESVVRNIVRGNEKVLRLHVFKREVTIMFSDIKGFTTISETLSQRDLLVLLTRYLTVMTHLVEFFGGVVTEILGDGVLAFWNTPDPVEKHASKACCAALAMQKAMVPLNEELEAMDLPELAIRIGLHTGMVLSGNLGSETKMKFGCMGDAVNLASRLEGLCKNYDAGILCSGETRQKAEGIVARALDLVQVKGKTEPTMICEVLGRDAPIPDEPAQSVVTSEQMVQVQLYEEALRAYHKADFTRAADLVHKVLEKQPEDKAALSLLERATRYAEPGALNDKEALDWTGVVVMMDK